MVERAVYRWDDPEAPVGVLEFDPFISPWVTETSEPKAAIAEDPQFLAELPAEGFRAACLTYEKQLLEAALEECRHNQRRAATLLMLSYDQLRHALRRHGLLDRAAQ